MIDDCSACTESANQLAACLRELHRLGLRRHASFSDCYRDYLETGCRLLGMETGIVSCIQGDRYEVLAVVSEEAGVIEGDVFPLRETYCSRVIEVGASVAVPAIGRDEAMSCHPAYRNAGLESYAAAPIWVFDRIYGTLSFTAAAARPGAFTDANIEFMEMMALSLGRIIERDLAEREREAALARMNENIERFESAFQYAAIGMALVSLEGQWLRVNKALVDLLGYSEEALLRMDFQRITHPDDLDTDLGMMQELLDKKRDSFRKEKRYFHRDGHIVWCLLSVSVVRYANGRLRYFVSQIQDITDRMRAEQPGLDTAAANSALPVLGSVARA